MAEEKRVAVVTGASSGIGAATAIALHQAGFDVVLGARRVEKLKAIAEPLDARYLPLDVTDLESVQAFCRELPVATCADKQRGRRSGPGYHRQCQRRRLAAHVRHQCSGPDANDAGTAAQTGSVGAGHVVNIGSIAGREAYPGGAGYNAVKFAVNAITKVMRLELVGKPIRITEVAPGMVETEFSEVRFSGDKERAAKVYQGLQPLTAEDIADVIQYVVTRPPHVNIDEVVVKPLAQASATVAARKTES